MGKRRSSRELAMKFLYQRELNDGIVEQQMEEFWERNPCQNEIQQFTEELLQTVFKNKKQIDEVLDKASDNWSLSRMAIIDRNLLRLAACEIMFNKNVPAKAVIDEAIEIAKKYGCGDSSSFINGVLDRINKEISCAPS